MQHELEPLTPSSSDRQDRLADNSNSNTHSAYNLMPSYDLGQRTIFDMPGFEDGYEASLLNQPRSEHPFSEGYEHSTTSTIPLPRSPLGNYDPEVPQKSSIEEGDEFCINYKPTDPGHPHAWSVREKWWILSVICTASVCVTATSSIQASTYTSLENAFGVPRITAVAGVSLYVLGFGVGALFLGPMSEFFGRRVIYLVSFALFTIFGIPVATAQNMGIFLFFRFVTGLCGSGFLSVAGGSVSDLFPPGTTDIPVAVYTLSPLIGPCIGPLLGGFINQHVTWRVTFYTVIAWSGLELLLLYFFVPETFLPVLLKNQAMAHRIRTGNGKWYAPMERNGKKLGDVFPGALYVPVQLMLTEKMALAMDLWTSLVLGIIYLFFNSIPYTFRTIYGFNLQSTGLAFIPMGIGMILATLTQVFWVKRIRNEAALNGGKAPPESRLPVGMAGAILVPLGLLWFSLCSFSQMPWIMPLFGTVLFGCGAVYVFTSVFGFLVSTYPKYAASAMAGNTLLRCVWAAAFPLFADAMYRKLGPEGATGLLASLAALMAPIPFVLYRNGARLREVSKYTS